jgi:hypothetical protein
MCTKERIYPILHTCFKEGNIMLVDVTIGINFDTIDSSMLLKIRTSHSSFEITAFISLSSFEINMVTSLLRYYANIFVLEYNMEGMDPVIPHFGKV